MHGWALMQQGCCAGPWGPRDTAPRGPRVKSRHRLFMRDHSQPCTCAMHLHRAPAPCISTMRPDVRQSLYSNACVHYCMRMTVRAATRLTVHAAAASRLAVAGCSSNPPARLIFTASCWFPLCLYGTHRCPVLFLCLYGTHRCPVLLLYPR